MPVCQKPMRLTAFIDNPDVVEKILRHQKLWCGPTASANARPPPKSDHGSNEPDFRIEYDTMPDFETVITN